MTRSVAIGLCEDFPANARKLAEIDFDLNLIAETGCTVLRIGMPWDSIAPSPDHYEWGFWDQVVDRANARGVRVIPYLCYTPKWASSGANKEDYWRWPPVEPRSFARFARAAADHFRGRVRSWELWNEPDNNDYWHGSAGQYAELVKAASSAIRDVDPKCAIVLGGISWNTDYLKVLLRDYRIGDWIDVVNLHAYFETWVPGSIEQVGEEINRASDLIARYGANQQIWVAEMGYSNYRQALHVSEAYDAVYAYEHTEEYQAQALLRSLITVSATDRASLMAWYRINDLPIDQAVIGDVNNRFLGLRTIEMIDKPAERAMHLATSILHGNIADIDANCTVSRPLRSDSVIHVLVGGRGDIFLIGWLQTDVNGALANTDRSGVSKDTRVEHVEVTIPSHCRLLSCRDAVENNLPLPPVESASETTSVHLTLEGDRTIVVELSANE